MASIKDEKLDSALAKAAPKVAEAAPKTSSSVLSLFRSLFFPLLPGIIGELVKRTKSPRDEKILRQVRDVLNGADLGEEG